MKKIFISGAIFLVIIVIILSGDNTEKTSDNYVDDIGKTFCNATNDVCDGTIIDVKTCTVSTGQQCYVVDRGEGYSRPTEHPISNGYAK